MCGFLCENRRPETEKKKSELAAGVLIVAHVCNACGASPHELSCDPSTLFGVNIWSTFFHERSGGGGPRYVANARRGKFGYFWIIGRSYGILWNYRAFIVGRKRLVAHAIK